MSEQKTETLRLKKISNVSIESIIGNTLLSAAKITTGIFAGSLGVLGDGIDSLGDILSSTLTLVTSKIISHPPDQRFPYGRQRADTVASKILAFIIFFFGAQLSYNTFLSFFSYQERPAPHIFAIVVTFASVIIKFILSRRLSKVGKETRSAMLITNSKNMQGDIVISLFVLLGLFFSIFINMGMIDLITAFVVGLWIMRTAIKVFMETNVELMDGLEDQEVYYKVFDAVDSVPGAHNPHRTRIRKFSCSYIIDLDIEVDGQLSITEGHEISRLVEVRIKQNLENVYDIMIHLEPLGNKEKERFGLTREKL